MRITFITSTMEGGGHARVIANLANYWCQKGWAVTVLSFEDGSSASFYPLEDGIVTTFLGLNRISHTLWESIINTLKRNAAIRKGVQESQPDVVISFIDTANVRTLLACLGLGIPVIVSERIHPEYEDIGRFWSLMRKLTYPLCAKLVVQTTGAADFFGWFVRKKTVVIPNPVLPSKNGEGKAPTLTAPSLLAVGRMYAQKNYPLLLRSFARCAQRHSEWTLCIAGEGPERPRLEALIRELGLEGRVQLLGQVSNIQGVLSQAELFVMSSRYEGFPNSLCEAMAAGLPVVSTDCPSGPAEILRDGVDGLLVPNEDEAELAAALGQLMNDSDLRARLAREATSVVDRFSLERIIKMWEKLLRGA